MKTKLKTGEKVDIDFAEKKHTFQKVNPFFLNVTTEGIERLISIEGTVEIRIDNLFFDNPYFFKWGSPIQASPKTTLKFILKLPLQKKLVIEAGKKDIEIQSYKGGDKKAWYGQVYEGVLCDFVEPEVIFKPEKGDFANVPVRVVNSGKESRLIKKFVIDSKYLMLYQADNGIFTNKVYVNIVGEDQFSITYGKTTTNSAKKPKKIIKAKATSQKKVLTSFSPLKLAKDFGVLED
jgi:hypothetical protein